MPNAKRRWFVSPAIILLLVVASILLTSCGATNGYEVKRLKDKLTANTELITQLEQANASMAEEKPRAETDLVKEREARQTALQRAEELSAELDSLEKHNQDLIDLYINRVNTVLQRLSEARGAPVTEDASSPWEVFSAFADALIARDLETLYRLTSDEFRQSCSLERFMEINEGQEMPKEKPAFLDQAIGKTFAVVETTVGYESQDIFRELLLAENGRWVIPLDPAICS